MACARGLVDSCKEAGEGAKRRVAECFVPWAYFGGTIAFPRGISLTDRASWVCIQRRSAIRHSDAEMGLGMLDEGILIAYWQGSVQGLG